MTPLQDDFVVTTVRDGAYLSLRFLCVYIYPGFYSEMVKKQMQEHIHTSYCFSYFSTLDRAHDYGSY